MNAEQLHNTADKFLLENFNLRLEIPLRISKRMKSKLGAFQIKMRDGKVISQEIVMSHTFIEHNDESAVIDVLFHECVHYALYTKRKPYRDSDSEFNETLDRLGISKTRTYQYKGESHLYECRTCGYQFTKRVKGYNKRYICRHCRGKFIYKGAVKT
ncbi:Protein SprT-like protein [Jeotgalicoccus saudimassiliensis]|uniref:Protein SprT-like protein n=1 Tax=Jeotgalicoccus saudimassiliensis TaxID=1461582 RepID=A0A078M567_9STAP|nr:SprT-like domain-containing protein [Jeotgalicoccus saudimassiliensis]CDZ99811.1 Protein SprT-like protein [Jeotgalicoccus saudimassiliensis]